LPPRRPHVKVAAATASIAEAGEEIGPEDSGSRPELMYLTEWTARLPAPALSKNEGLPAQFLILQKDSL
jgi:hypothetical protein